MIELGSVTDAWNWTTECPKIPIEAFANHERTLEKVTWSIDKKLIDNTAKFEDVPTPFTSFMNEVGVDCCCAVAEGCLSRRTRWGPRIRGERIALLAESASATLPVFLGPLQARTLVLAALSGSRPPRPPADRPSIYQAWNWQTWRNSYKLCLKQRKKRLHEGEMEGYMYVKSSFGQWTKWKQEFCVR